MGRTLGTPNKITAQVRNRLDNLIEGLVDSIHIEDLNTSQRIKMLQIALQYTLPRLQAMVVKDETEKEDEPIFINVYERKKDSNEENWQDNFEVTNTHKIEGYKT
tara:strand:+ start:261 stop:575 length:315 start_codon:yes stop_codon:yes gene_type:complete